ncbi:unnamed protein product [marine sediment metagenome]|uniref:Uncharacterized protein n=1 Tax=marine sediment metagenome TaxID=412755 RepID=X1UGY6_9ZZZZ
MVIVMADPWGPAKRQVTGLNEWMARFDAQDIDAMLIDAPWVGNKPIYVAENASIIIGALDDAAGIQQIVNAAGEVTEASAAGAALYLEYIYQLGMMQIHPYFGQPNATSAANSANARKRFFQTTLTADGAGEIVAANVGPPTLATYQSCMLLTHVWSDDADAITFTIAPTAGAFDTGLATMIITTVADTVTPDYNGGLAWICGTDAATIQFAAAAGMAQALQNVTLCGVYWYET